MLGHGCQNKFFTIPDILGSFKFNLKMCMLSIDDCCFVKPSKDFNMHVHTLFYLQMYLFIFNKFLAKF